MQQFAKLLEEMPQQKISPPSNTIAHIFRRDYKENFISDWLAYLLNPEFTNNTQPLAALLKQALGEEPDDLSDVSIYREFTFKDNRRIDFYIETSNYVIGIENKIWSDLQANQLLDYEKQLTSNIPLNGRKLVLILLCPQNNKCCTNPNLNLYGFNRITYEDLVEEFKKIRFNLFENLRATIYMEDFIAHTEEYIMSNPDKNKSNLEMWRFEADNKEKLLDLWTRFETSRKQFGKYISERLSAIVAGREDNGAWESPSVHPSIKEPYFQIYKTNWAYAQVHFELRGINQFPPTELEVVLHTREKSKTGKTQELYDLQGVVAAYMKKKYGTDVFPVNYDTEAAFEQSMCRIFDALLDLVNQFTEQVDAGIRPKETK